ncbi:MAG: nitrous oxide reductase accessory protein NosL [Rhodobacterales bacterium]|nr:nitrous oxide reductase accessory protein NosL [Rhodobacterales bacterium]
MKVSPLLALLLPLAFVAGCKDDDLAQGDLPAAQILTEDAAGHYCQMVILEHQGPKAQVFLDGMDAPLWFSQVRDGVAYLKSPEQSAEIRVLYVNDMGAAISWSEPGPENWIDAKTAYFVVGSDAIGGMGAPEIAPFSDPVKANEFASDHGGKVLKLDDISAETVLSPVEFANNETETTE